MRAFALIIFGYIDVAHFRGSLSLQQGKRQLLSFSKRRRPLLLLLLFLLLVQGKMREKKEEEDASLANGRSINPADAAAAARAQVRPEATAARACD